MRGVGGKMGDSVSDDSHCCGIWDCEGEVKRSGQVLQSSKFLGGTCLQSNREDGGSRKV